MHLLDRKIADDIWVIAKPETVCHYSKTVKDYLWDNCFVVNKAYTLKNWRSLAMRLYENSHKISLQSLDITLLAMELFLGSKASHTAELWLIKHRNRSGESATLSDYVALKEVKEALRNRLWNSSLTIRIHSKHDESIFHYSYIHVPEPDKEVIYKELEIIKEYIT